MTSLLSITLNKTNRKALITNPYRVAKVYYYCSKFFRSSLFLFLFFCKLLTFFFIYISSPGQQHRKVYEMCCFVPYSLYFFFFLSKKEATFKAYLQISRPLSNCTLSRNVHGVYYIISINHKDMK